MTAHFLSLVFIACTDPHTPEYLNPHDPNSMTYVPNAPSNVTVSFAGETERRLSWQDNSAFEVGYRIERKLGETGVFSILGQVGKNVTTFSDTGIILTDTTYYYRVSSLSERGNLGTDSLLRVSVPFPSPKDLHMTCLSQTSVQLEWNDRSPFELGFIILQSMNGQPFLELQRTAADVPSYTVTGMNPASTYRFMVQAYTRHNISKYSETLSLTYVNSPVELLYTRSIQRNDQAVSSMTFSPDGKTLACGGEYYVELFRVGDGYNMARLAHDYNHPVWSVKFSPDGSVLASGHRGSVYLWNPRTFERISRLYNYGTNDIFSVRFTPDGNTIAAADDGGYIQLWRSNTYLGSYNGNNWNNRTIDISPDGQFLATGDSLMVLRVSNGAHVRSFPTSIYLRSIIFHPAGKIVSCVGANDYKIELWNLSDGSLVRSIQESYYLRDLSFDPVGRRIAGAGREDGKVNIWDVETGALLVSLNNSAPSMSLAFSPLNNIIATGDTRGTVRMWGFNGTWKTDF